MYPSQKNRSTLAINPLRLEQAKKLAVAWGGGWTARLVVEKLIKLAMDKPDFIIGETMSEKVYKLIRAIETGDNEDTLSTDWEVVEEFQRRVDLILYTIKFVADNDIDFFYVDDDDEPTISLKEFIDESGSFFCEKEITELLDLMQQPPRHNMVPGSIRLLRKLGIPAERFRR